MKIIYKVHIVNTETDEIARSFYGGNKEAALKLERNINVNLNTETHHTSLEKLER